MDAEWIVEDFYSSQQQVALAKFKDIWFEAVGATTASGRNIGVDGAAMVQLKADDGSVLCSASEYDNSNFVASFRG